MSRLKILAIAYACNPTRGSEFGVGWGWVRAISSIHEVTVITADFNASDIEAYQKTGDSPHGDGLRFLYIHNRPWHYRPVEPWLTIEHSPVKPLMNISYQNWLSYAVDEARQELARDRYDLIHLITYVGWRFPGKFYQLGVPFVWGPIGGLKNTTWRLLPILGVKGALYYGMRNLINSAQLRFLPGPRRALRSANRGVIAATSEIQHELQIHFGAKSRVICEVGPPEIASPTPKSRSVMETFKICWSGEHQQGKALHLLLRAVANLSKNIDFCVEILGDGPSNPSWKSLACQLEIEDRCHWHGWLPREESLTVMKDSHVFVITSLKDLTSNVAVEAISLGLPVICLDHCGFADLVTDQCGIKVVPRSAHQIVSDLANAIRKLYLDEPFRLALAHGALQRRLAYSWTSKMAALDQIYLDVTSSDSGIR